jgi:ribokinase
MLVVVGSANLDRVQRVEQLPQVGETVHGHSFATYFGGKGANQAVAAARGGASVRFVGQVGEDDAGEALRAALQRDGIDDVGLRTVPGASGFATILVAANGENVIVLEAGANGRFPPESVQAADLKGAAIVLCQLEIPLPTVVRAFTLARAQGALTILNAAPPDCAAEVPAALVDVLVVNAGEGQRLAGAPLAPEVCVRALAALYPAVVMTLGAEGVLWWHRGALGRLPARSVSVVDTTGAGDTFVGVLAASLALGRSWGEGMARAVAAASLCVTRPGAQASIPTAAEVDALLR